MSGGFAVALQNRFRRMRKQSIFDKILKAELEKAVAECERLREENARLRARKKRTQKPVVGSLCGATR